jgi:putative Holliday junction resolvase
MSAWMGVDLGNARVGISLSDPERSVAYPLCNVHVWTDYFEALEEVADLVDEHHVERVVVGYPLNMDGSEGKAAKKARRWSQQLRRRLSGEDSENFVISQSEDEKKTEQLGKTVEVVLKDERLTTVTAHHQLSQVGRSSRSHRQVVDQQSAVLILQSALDEFVPSSEFSNGGQ